MPQTYKQPVVYNNEDTTKNINTTKCMNNYTNLLNYSKLNFKQYQYDGIKWCVENELNDTPIFENYIIKGGFIADEMGLGKTIMMIGLMYCNFMKNTLIVVPPILIDQWYMQIHKITGYKALIYYGKNKNKITKEQLQKATIVITSYGMVTCSKSHLKANMLTVLHDIFWDRIMFDEAHHLRNSNTVIHQSCQRLCTNIKWIISGTPVQNRKQDFYSLCSIVGMPIKFYSSGNNRILLTTKFILKRTKKQVGIDLPDISYTNTNVNWENKEISNIAESLHSKLHFSNIKETNCMFKYNNIFNHIKGSLVTMLRAKQLCIYPKLLVKPIQKIIKEKNIPSSTNYNKLLAGYSKIDAIVNAIFNNINNNCGKLVFCYFRDEIDDIRSKLNIYNINTSVIDGRTSITEKQHILRSVPTVLILQISTGCEGINLQDNYSEIYFTSRHWNPAIEAQAIARCHRIGQTKPVKVFYFNMTPFDLDYNVNNNEKCNNVDCEGDNLNKVNIDYYMNTVQIYKKKLIDSIMEITD